MRSALLTGCAGGLFKDTRLDDALAIGRTAGLKPYWARTGAFPLLREFLHVEDCADALVFMMTNYSGENHVNIGSGEELSIADLAALTAEIVGYYGAFRFNQGKPDGTPRKFLDVSLLQGMGWQATTALREGLSKTYAWYQAQSGMPTRSTPS
jgi:GDP-L-fucose synthase